MKKILLSAALATLPFCAQAQKSFDTSKAYLSIPVGYSVSIKHSKEDSVYHDGKLKNSALYGIGAGYDFDFLRAEFNYIARPGMKFTAHRENDISEQDESQKIKAKSFMLNVYKDFKNSTSLTPYVVGGLGFTKVRTEQFNTTQKIGDDTTSLSASGKDKNNFTWQLGLGVAYKLSSDLTLDASYRYTDLGKALGIDPTDESAQHTRLKSSDFMLALRISF
jgi:outer membrane immunogenic protein